ncbi:MAG: efflux RND transporter periplasmic adaptor subunit [Chlorobium sp.]|uniref:efflux RND transporter periplasmic adaptor subunit n=1 Tax=Chlorobium sp. TaxID=1095 RepID=UPI0025C309AD|nr:efflux RND transporter periplasmic adaptor subunit [Chlorobium sp.]MCF8382063.1 efflux RND transporter periplasmic adaptor subunit [Chlorobium sp.]
MKQKKLAIVILVIAALSGLFWWQQHRSEPLRQDSAYSLDVPVTVVPVRLAVVRDSLALTGTAEAFRDVEVFSETGGLVRKAMAEIGDRKASGEVLFVVDDELQHSALKKANAAFEKADLDHTRYLNLFREGAVSPSGLEVIRLKREEAEADLIEARRKYRDTRIKAPVSGTVTMKILDEGEMVQPGMKVANLVDLSQVRIRFFLSEREVRGIAPGYPLEIRGSDGAGPPVLQGRVTSVSGKAGRDKTYEAEAVLPNFETSPLRAGMFVRVILAAKESREALVVPRTALAGSIMKPEVYVVRNGVARLRKVTAGSEFQEQLEILGGLAAGEQVVTSGQNELHDGTKVTIIPQKNMDSAR